MLLHYLLALGIEPVFCFVLFSVFGQGRIIVVFSYQNPKWNSLTVC